MSVLAYHRIAIAAMLGAVPEIGIVHDEEVFATTEAAFRALYAWDDGSGKKQVRGWFIRRTKTAEKELGLGRVMNSHTWTIRGFMALMPPDTGKEFDELVEAIRQRYRNDETLGGAVDPGPLTEQTGVQLTDSGTVYFSGVLCHSAALQLTTHAYLNSGE